MTKIEQIKAEIERRIKAYDDIHEKKELDDIESMYAVELSRELENLFSFIESLEKEQPDLDAVSYCFDKGINISPRQATAIATHFYSLGQLRSISGPKIKGWVARNPNGEVFFSVKEPHQVLVPGKGQRPYYTIWDDEEHFEMHLPKIAKQLPDEPIEVELIIKKA